MTGFYLMIGERLIELREKLGFKHTSAFAEHLGIKRPTLASYENNTYPPSADFLVKVKDKCGVSIDWVLTGEGPMLLQKTRQAKALSRTNEPQQSSEHVSLVCSNANGKIILQKGTRLIHVEDDPEGEIALVDLISQRLGAGTQELLADIHVMKRLPILRHLLLPYGPEDVKAAIVRGDSMTGINLFDGDIVFFVPEEKQGDGIFVISFHGEFMVKRLSFNKFKKTVTIISENERYPEKEVIEENAENFRIEGKVKGWIHRHPY